MIHVKEYGLPLPRINFSITHQYNRTSDGSANLQPGVSMRMMICQAKNDKTAEKYMYYYIICTYIIELTTE